MSPDSNPNSPNSSNPAASVKANALFTSEKKLDKPRKKSGCFSIALTVIALLLVVSVFNGIARNFGQSPEESPSATTSGETFSTKPSGPKPESLLEALGLSEEQYLQGLATVCPSIELTIQNSALATKTASRITDLKKVSDPYEAERFVTEREWAKALAASATPAEIEAEISDSLNLKLVESKFEGAAQLEVNYPPLHNAYLSEFTKDVLDTCGLAETVENLNVLSAQAERVVSLAENVPWYPKGFRAHSDGLTAWKWADRSCSYYSGSCSHMDVVSSLGCSSLYVEVNFLDSSDSVVDWSNDTAKSLSPGQIAKLEFVSFDESVTSSQLGEISCY